MEPQVPAATRRAVALYTATWSADDLVQRVAASPQGAIWPHRVCIAQDSLHTLEDYGFAQVVTRCPATANLLGFRDVDVICGPGVSRRSFQRQGPGQAWQLVGMNGGDIDDLLPLDAASLPPVAAAHLLPAAARLLPPHWQWAYATSSAFLVAQAATQRQLATPFVSQVYPLEELLAAPLSGAGQQPRLPQTTSSTLDLSASGKESKVAPPALDAQDSQQSNVVAPALDAQDSQQSKVALPALDAQDSQQCKVTPPALDIWGGKDARTLSVPPSSRPCMVQLMRQSLPAALSAAAATAGHTGLGCASLGRTSLGLKPLTSCSSGPALEGHAPTFLRCPNLVRL